MRESFAYGSLSYDSKNSRPWDEFDDCEKTGNNDDVNAIVHAKAKSRLGVVGVEQFAVAARSRRRRRRSGSWRKMRSAANASAGLSTEEIIRLEGVWRIQRQRK